MADQEEIKKQASEKDSKNGDASDDDDDEDANKVHVGGIDKFLTASTLTKELAKRNLYPVKIRKAPKSPWAVMRFVDTAARDAAIPLLNKIEIKGRKFFAKIHKGAAYGEKDNSSNKRKHADGDDDERRSKPRPTDIRQVATPLFEMPYSEQLVLKEASMTKECAIKATRRIRSAFKKRQTFFRQQAQKDGTAHQNAARSNMPDWLTPQGPPVEGSSGANCIPMEPIRPSPITEGYRNKCDFTIGLDEDKQPVIGFCLGRNADGSVIVAPPYNCANVSAKMKDIVKSMEGFLKASPFQPYEQGNHTGCWRSMILRGSERTGDSMAFITVTTSRLDPAQWEEEKARMIQEVGAMVSSLYIQIYDGVSTAPPDHPVVHLAGKEHIVEELFNLKFNIAPDAFFQTNTRSCEVLYGTVLELAELKEGDTLVDVCCGTGTIGICASAQSSVPISVVGVELCAASVACAKENAILNNIENASFVCSRAELVLEGMLKSTSGSVVAVVDPPRSGLHRSCLEAIRNCSAIQKLVYVSCNPTGSMVSDLEVLCGPSSKTLTGAAFVPVKAVPVDIFPLTDHCEMVMAFVRNTESD